MQFGHRAYTGADGGTKFPSYREYWVCWWKRDKASDFVEMIRTFGVCDSYQEMAGKVEQKILTDREFRIKFSGGAFYLFDVMKRIDPKDIVPLEVV